MRFSIIIPAHNSENYIIRALESVQQQTFKDYELIVVCDSCTDNTEAVAKKYGATTYRVGYHRDGLTRNEGIARAKGEYVLFIDDDDWWLHEYVLELLDQKLKENPLIDVLCFSFIFKGVKYATPTSNGGRHYVAVWNKCWRHSFIANVKFSGEISTSDLVFNRDAMAKLPKLLDWDMPMYYYNYMRAGSQTERDTSRKVLKNIQNLYNGETK